MAFVKGKTKLKLIGKDDNAYAILGFARVAMQKAGGSMKEWDDFKKEATSGDYDHLLRTCCEWFKVS